MTQLSLLDIPPAPVVSEWRQAAAVRIHARLESRAVDLQQREDRQDQDIRLQRAFAILTSYMKGRN